MALSVASDLIEVLPTDERVVLERLVRVHESYCSITADESKALIMDLRNAESAEELNAAVQHAVDVGYYDFLLHMCEGIPEQFRKLGNWELLDSRWRELYDILVKRGVVRHG